MKNFSDFKKLNENVEYPKYFDDDFKFRTKLENNEITIYGSPFKEDYDDIDSSGIAVVEWELQFDWMGDSGIEINVVVNKVHLDLTFTLYKGDEEIEKEYEKTIEGDFGDLDTNKQISFSSIQYLVDGIEYDFDTDKIEVYF